MSALERRGSVPSRVWHAARPDRYIYTAGPGPSGPPAIVAHSILGGAEEGREYRLADAPRHISVRVLDDSVRIDVQPAAEPAVRKQRVLFRTRDLGDLARLCARWRAGRIGWYAYAGYGAPYWGGRSPLLHYSPGRWKPRVIRTPGEVDRVRERSCLISLRPPARGECFGSFRVERVLESGLHERIGVVVRAPGRRCLAVLLRSHVLLIGRPRAASWPVLGRHVEALARWYLRPRFECPESIGGWCQAERRLPTLVTLNAWSAVVIEVAAGMATVGLRSGARRGSPS